MTANVRCDEKGVITSNVRHTERGSIISDFLVTASINDHHNATGAKSTTHCSNYLIMSARYRVLIASPLVNFTDVMLRALSKL